MDILQIDVNMSNEQKEILEWIAGYNDSTINLFIVNIKREVE